MKLGIGIKKAGDYCCGWVSNEVVDLVSCMWMTMWMLILKRCEVAVSILSLVQSWWKHAACLTI